MDARDLKVQVLLKEQNSRVCTLTVMRDLGTGGGVLLLMMLRAGR